MMQGQDTLTIEQLDYKFVSVDRNTITPVTDLSSIEVAGVFLPCLTRGLLEFCGPNDLSLWVDGRFFGEKKTSGCLHFQATDLCRIGDRDTVFLTITTQRSLFGVTARTIEVSEGQSSSNQLSQRQSGPRDIIGFIFGGILIIGFSYLTPSSSRKSFSPFDDSGDPSTLVGIIQWIFICFFLAFCWNLSTGTGVAGLLLSLLFVGGFWFIKWLNIRISSELFGMRSTGKWLMHFHRRFWWLAALMLFFGLLIESLSLRIFLSRQSNLTLILAIILSANVMMGSLFLTVKRAIKSLHLFIYLCTIEILPAILVMYLFLK